jgi:hypothetical protein
MNTVTPVLGDNALILFFLLSIPVFVAAWLVSNTFRAILSRYLQEQYEELPEMTLDEETDEAATADYIELQLPQVSSFAFSLYLFAAPFLFAYLTLGISYFQAIILPFSGIIQLILVLTSYSNNRKMQANISLILFIIWGLLAYFFIDIRSFF